MAEEHPTHTSGHRSAHAAEPDEVLKAAEVPKEPRKVISANSPLSMEIRDRVRPREMHEGDPLVRKFVWAGEPALECRHMVQFQGPEEGPIWSMACCKTFFTWEQLSDHWAEDHNDSLPEDDSEEEEVASAPTPAAEPAPAPAEEPPSEATSSA